MISSLNINFTVHQKDIYPISRMYDNAEGFDIKVTAENGDAMAKELYLLVQKYVLHLCMKYVKISGFMDCQNMRNLHIMPDIQKPSKNYQS